MNIKGVKTIKHTPQQFLIMPGKPKVLEVEFKYMNAGQFIYNLILKMLYSSCKSILKLSIQSLTVLYFQTCWGIIWWGIVCMCAALFKKNAKFIVKSGLLYFCSKNIRQMNSHIYVKKVTKNTTKNYPK